MELWLPEPVPCSEEEDISFNDPTLAPLNSLPSVMVSMGHPLEASGDVDVDGDADVDGEATADVNGSVAAVATVATAATAATAVFGSKNKSLSFKFKSASCTSNSLPWTQSSSRNKCSLAVSDVRRVCTLRRKLSRLRSEMSMLEMRAAATASAASFMASWSLASADFFSSFSSR